MSGPLLFGLLISLLVLLGFVGLWRTLRVRDRADLRLLEYGVDTAVVASGTQGKGSRRLGFPALTRLLSGFSSGQRLASALAQADLPLTAAEFALITLGLALAGYIAGSLRGGPALGLLIAVGAACLPLLYLRRRKSKRLKAFTAQLADVLTMLTGALRAGYGLTQALDMLSKQLPPPASKEFARVMRSVGLGQPVQQALREMATRMASDDLELIVTAITVQHEMGGNLAQTLETIGATVRDRLRMLQEIRVLTAQQRFTGYFLAVWPVVMAVAIYFINPKYMLQFLQPGWIRLLPIGAVVMEIIGFLVIRKIVDIEV